MYIPGLSVSQVPPIGRVACSVINLSLSEPRPRRNDLHAGVIPCLRPPRCVSTGPVVVRLAERAMNVNVNVNCLLRDSHRVKFTGTGTYSEDSLNASWGFRGRTHCAHMVMASLKHTPAPPRRCVRFTDRCLTYGRSVVRQHEDGGSAHQRRGRGVPHWCGPAHAARARSQ